MALFKDKTVVLIGPAPHILDEVQDFSGYDYVCRINDMVPLSDKVIRATGERTDVLYARRRIMLENPTLCECADVIITTDIGLRDTPEEYKSKVRGYACPDVRENNDSALEKKLECLPNTGLRAMVDILYQKPKELYITGFTFYNGKTHYKGYGRDKKHERKHQKRGGEIGRHKQKPQFKYFKKHIAPYVKMDNKLMELL